MDDKPVSVTNYSEKKEELSKDNLQADLVNACRSGKVDVVKMLLNKGADPNDYGIMEAAQRLEFDEFIEKGGINKLEKALTNQKMIGSGKRVLPLHATIKAGQKSTRNMALIMRGRKGPSLEAITNCVKVLLLAGADPNKRDHDLNTPIFFCSLPSIARILEAEGADFTLVNERNCTPLHLAVRDGNLAMTKFLTKDPLLQTSECIAVNRLLKAYFRSWPADIIKIIADFTASRFFLDVRGTLIPDERDLTALEYADLKFTPWVSTGEISPNYEAVVEHLKLTKRNLLLINSDNSKECLTDRPESLNETSVESFDLVSEVV